MSGGPTPSLDAYPVVVRLPVQWGEMDAYGHVNNTVLFRYFETGRIAYLERVGFADLEARNGIGAILHSTRCRFRLPLHYPDAVSVAVRGRIVAEDRFAMDYLVVSERHQAVVAEGEGLIVSYDYRAGRKAPLPPDVRRAIDTLEAGAA